MRYLVEFRLPDDQANTCTTSWDSDYTDNESREEDEVESDDDGFPVPIVDVKRQ